MWCDRVGWWEEEGEEGEFEEEKPSEEPSEESYSRDISPITVSLKARMTAAM
jgi:hypothetical protein